MQVVLVSNYLNHHQLPFCNAMISLVGEKSFRFVATAPFNQARLAAGYTDMNNEYPWVIRAYESAEEMEYAIRVTSEARIAIISPECTAFSEARLLSDGVSFIYSERLLKRGNWPVYVPSYRRRVKDRFSRFVNESFYVLCSSAWTASDLSRFGVPQNRCMKWGYFTYVPEENQHRYENEVPRILWVGRMLGWKHPEDLLQALAILDKRGYNFIVDFVGEGEKKELLEKLAGGLNCEVRFHGALSNSEVRKLMSECDLFVATSDRREGWGAVVNEALASGCAVVASNAMGSVPFLLEEERGGFQYRSRNTSDLAEKMGLLLSDRSFMEKCGQDAHSLMNEVWSPAVSAERLLVLAESLRNNESSPFFKGPCSPA